MSIYIVFFGKSQDFTTCYYDRNNPIHDFNSVIKDFDLLESKTFTVDDIKNKEILSRYFFTAQGKNYCLLKLYSFAQAYSGNRIAGSIYGVGLLSDKAIAFDKDNLGLLRWAKDNFAEISLEGVKFNKSNFQNDTDRIWKAIVSNKDCNYLDKVVTSTLRINGSVGQVTYFVQDLFSDAVQLNDRISNKDSVYFSEDLEHLKRTQNKWGEGAFPIYWKQNNEYVRYKELVVKQPTQSSIYNPSDDISKGLASSDMARLRVELEDSQYKNKTLQKELKKIKEKQKNLWYSIYGLGIFSLLLIVYNFNIIFSEKNNDKTVVDNQSKVKSNSTEKPDPISVFLKNGTSVKEGITFLKSIESIYKLDNNQALSDSSSLEKEIKKIEITARKNNIKIDSVKKFYENICKNRKYNRVKT
jgi:hypothetical protein